MQAHLKTYYLFKKVKVVSKIQLWGQKWLIKVQPQDQPYQPLCFAHQAAPKTSVLNLDGRVMAESLYLGMAPLQCAMCNMWHGCIAVCILFAPQGALVVMMGYYTSSAGNFLNSHSAH